MKIAIIGTGRMARGFASALAPKHEVTIGSRDADRASAAASATGASRGATYADAAADAKVVILTVPWHQERRRLSHIGERRQTLQEGALRQAIHPGSDDDARRRKSQCRPKMLSDLQVQFVVPTGQYSNSLAALLRTLLET